jgi:hypothetical protein
MGTNFKDVLKAKAERAEREDRPKVEWFSLKNGETKFIRLLQEFDTDMRNYDSKFGTAEFLVEHQSPEEWSRKALCTTDTEGRCFACAMDKEEPFILLDELDGDGNRKKKWHPWGQKTNFYVYVVDNKGAVRVLSRTTDGKLFDSLVEEAEENNNSLTDITFKISKGSANQNPWEIRKTTKEHFELPEIDELVALSTAVGLKVPFEDQKNFYLPKSNNNKADVAVNVPSTEKKIGEDW